MQNNPSAVNGPPAPKANILLVDDHPANLLALEAILDDLGHNLVRASSGEEALRLLLDQDFAVVLLDVQMHGLDGFETAQRLRGRERSRHTPIIFLTAHDDNRLSAAEAYALGAVDYLHKPVVPIILRAKVTGFVELFQKTEQVRLQAEQLRQLERREFEHKLAEENARRRRTTEALHESEERFRQLAENINAVFWMTDPRKERILYVSPAYETVWGRPCASLYAQPQSFLDAIHPDDRARVITLSLERQARGETADVEYRVVRPDGSIRWVRDRGFPVKDPTGAVYRTAGIAEDITERKQAEALLRESEQRLRAILDNWPSVIFVKDLEGRYLLANRACELYSGEPPARMLGKTDYDYLPREVADRYRADDLRVLDTGAALRYEESAPLRGEARVALTVKFPLGDTAGKVYAVCGIATDITDLKRAEEALKQADRRKDEFLAMLAHELRNPLAPIRNAVQVMNLLGGGEPNLQRAREMIDRQVKHLARLVDDLLDVSRITRGKINIHKEPVELATVIARAVETSRPLLDARGQALAVSLPPEPVLVEGDATRLAQVFANLLNNAAKYTNDGGRVAVTVERDGGEIVVRVRDTGIGIPAELLPRVFDLFTQGDRSLARSEGGLGIGLTLVRSLVEMHGGKAEAFSAGPGQGSEFVVRLPILERRRSRRPAPGEAEAAGHGTTPRRILVVDDNHDAAESLALLLRAEGHEVRTAHDGATALDAVRAYQPEIVLLDIGLPKMDGYEVARRLRAQEGTRRALLVALTGYGQEEDRRRAAEAGFDAHLVKPADLGALHALLGEGQAGPL